VKRSFLKRSLLLSAASVAVLSVPAFADDLTISSATTTAVKTSTAANNSPGDITINSNGSITITQAGPAVTLNSSNDVSILGNLSNKNTTGAQGILIDTGTAATAATETDPDTITGTLSVTPVNSDTVTSIDLSGSGTGKTGLLISGNGKFGGNINFGNALIGPVTMAIQGDDSTGIAMLSTAILHGNLDISSSISVTPSTANETTTTGISVVNLAGTITGNVTIEAGSSLVAYGDGSLGVVSTGVIEGSFVNSGTISVESFQQSQNQSTGAYTLPKGSGDPIGGPAVEIGSSIKGGFMNSGPTDLDTTIAPGVIITDGGSASGPMPVLIVSSAGNGAPLEIGVYNPTTADPNPGYSFYNRGIIANTSAAGGANSQSFTGPIDPNLSVAGVEFMGSSTAHVTLDGKGLFNSGNIAAGGRTTSSGSAPISVIGLAIGSLITQDATGASSGFVYVGAGSDPTSGIYNRGTITASASGDLGAAAMAINIGKTSVVNSLTNLGSISATVQTNNPSTVQTEIMYAINDQSGTLNTITNSGTISAVTTTPLLAAGSNTTTIAAYLGNNTTGVTFTNTGLVQGDVIFGDGTDTLTVGNSTAAAQLIGNLSFGGVNSSLSGTDKLIITDNGFVSGQIHEAFAGQLDISVSSAATLSVQNNTAAYGTLLVNNLNVAQNGTLNIAVSTVLPNNTSISGNNITLTNAGTDPNHPTINVIYSSFIPATGHFVLLQAPTGHLTIDNIAQVEASINSAKPFLFNGSADYLQNQSGFDQLVLDLAPKTSAQLGLSGYAAQVFPYANAALENDDTLGAAMIRAINSNATAQTAYSQFAPDASGGTRAIAISLTDHATGPVAARQRALRLYATQPGDLTLWGQEFAQQISDKGSDGLPGFKDSGFGFAMGADGGDAQTGWYGGAFTFYTGNVDQRAPASSRDNTQWYMLSGYSTWRGKGLFLDTQLTAGYGDLSEHRFITLVDPSSNTLLAVRQTNSKRSSALAALGMTTGANLVYGSTTITPNIALDGLTMREEGYTETGGGGTTGDAFDLHVDPVVMSSMRAFVGLNARQDVNFGSFYMQPELRAGYRYDFLADRIDLTAYFPGVSPTATGPGTGPFTVTGPKPSKGNLLAGASISATTGAWSIGVNYDMLSGQNGSMTQVGSLSLVGRI